MASRMDSHSWSTGEMKPSIGMSSSEARHFGVVVLGERLDLVVPAAAHDLVIEPVSLVDPLGGICRAPVLLRHLDRPVQGDPALEPAVGEVLLAAAGLPDSLVGLVLR